MTQTKIEVLNEVLDEVSSLLKIANTFLGAFVECDLVEDEDDLAQIKEWLERYKKLGNRSKVDYEKMDCN